MEKHLHLPSQNTHGRGSTKSLKLKCPYPGILIPQQQCESDLSYLEGDLMLVLHSVKSTQIRTGRGICRMIDMFASPADLIMENHRHLEAEASDEALLSTTEYVMFTFNHAIVKLTAWQRGSTLPLV